MTCDELVNLFENNGADGGFPEIVLSGGMTGAEFKDMLVDAGQHRRLSRYLPTVQELRPYR
jgi:hypothetical protein